jgi:hypothetical protein
VTFVDWRDMQRWKLINDALGLGQPEPAETYSTSEHLYAELSIPPDATGTLPRAMRARAGLSAEATEDLGETGRTRSRPSRPRGRTRGGAGRETRQFDGGATPHDKAGTADRAETPARNRRRRRTRAGREVAGNAAGEIIIEVHPESGQQQAS